MLPAQPEISSATKIKPSTEVAKMTCLRRRGLKSPKRRTNAPTVVTVVAAVVTVNVVETGDCAERDAVVRSTAGTTTLPLANAHVLLSGAPLQVNSTVPVKPFLGVTVIAEETDRPATTVID